MQTLPLTAISRQLLKKGFTVLKNIIPQIKRFQNGFEKKFPDLKFFPWFWLKTPFSPDFSDWKKSSKFSLIGGNPARKMDTVRNVYKKVFQSNAKRSLADRCMGYLVNKSGGDPTVRSNLNSLNMSGRRDQELGPCGRAMYRDGAGALYRGEARAQYGGWAGPGPV